jgi:aspartyl-tRNA synthetase
VNPPKLVASQLRVVLNFSNTTLKREAFLGLSPQLYKQMMMGTGFDKVFEIAPSVRAENMIHPHLNEVISIDVENGICQ